MIIHVADFELKKYNLDFELNFLLIYLTYKTIA